MSVKLNDSPGRVLPPLVISSMNKSPKYRECSGSEMTQKQGIGPWLIRWVYLAGDKDYTHTRGTIMVLP